MRRGARRGRLTRRHWSFREPSRERARRGQRRVHGPRIDHSPPPSGASGRFGPVSAPNRPTTPRTGRSDGLIRGVSAADRPMELVEDRDRSFRASAEVPPARRPLARPPAARSPAARRPPPARPLAHPRAARPLQARTPAPIIGPYRNPRHRRRDHARDHRILRSVKLRTASLQAGGKHQGSPSGRRGGAGPELGRRVRGQPRRRADLFEEGDRPAYVVGRDRAASTGAGLTR